MNSTLAAVLSGVALLSVLAGCQQHHHAENGLLKVGSPERAKDFSALDRFKALEGRWVGGTSGDNEIDYRVVSAGSAVEERLFPGLPHEMVTMYFTHYGELYATHYCAGKNAPTMHGHWHEKDATWHFEHVSTTNADTSTTGVMGEMSYTFIDADTIRTSWGSVMAGKSVGEPKGGLYKRAAKRK